MLGKRPMTIRTVGVVIPVYQPGEIFSETLVSLFEQSYSISRLVILDSSPSGESAKKMVEEKSRTVPSELIEYIRIAPERFDHGGTRNIGVEQLSAKGEIDAVLFLTQDAVMAPDCLERLVEFLEAHDLAAAYARQLPRIGAHEFEAAERLQRYPPESHVTFGKPQNIDDVFFSNVCSLIRIDAFYACGGFPEKIIMAEDMIMALRLLEHDFAIGYCAEALVQHSHSPAFWRTVQRFFDTGVMHTDWESRLPLNTAGNKAVSLVLYQVRHLLRRRPFALPRLCINVLAKYLGYRLGRHYTRIPMWLTLKLTQNRQYWLA